MKKNFLILILFLTQNLLAESALDILKVECEKNKSGLACYKLSEILFKRKDNEQAIKYLQKTCVINTSHPCRINLQENAPKEVVDQEHLDFLEKLKRCDDIQWREESSVGQAKYASTKKIKDICLYTYNDPGYVESSCRFSQKNIENLIERTKNRTEFLFEFKNYISLGVCERLDLTKK